MSAPVQRKVSQNVKGQTRGIKSAAEVQEMIKQFIAELSLLRLAKGYPTKIGLAQFPRKKRKREAKQERVHGSFRNVANVESVQEILAMLTQEHEIPFLESSLSGGPVPFDDLIGSASPEYQFGRNSYYLVQDQISQQSLQGKVYKAIIFPSSDGGHRLIDEALAEEYPFVNAAIKNSPIIPVEMWKYILQLQILMRRLDRKEEVNELEATFLEDIPDLFFLAEVRSISASPAARAEFQEEEEEGDIDAILRRVVASELSAALQTADAMYSSPANDAYVDSFGSFLGSKLAERLLTPLFPLMYGSFITRDLSFVRELNGAAKLFPPDDVDAAIPVQTTITQLLDGTLSQLEADQFFLVDSGNRHRALAEPRVKSLFAQVILGLSCAQEYIDLTHGDLHDRNVLFKSLARDGDQYLYYEVRPSRIFAPAGDSSFFLRVPLLGMQYYVIDFGFSSYKGTLISTECYGSICPEAREIKFTVRPTSYPSRHGRTDAFSSDLETLVNMFVMKHRQQIRDGSSQWFNNFVRSINLGVAPYAPPPPLPSGASGTAPAPIDNDEYGLEEQLSFEYETSGTGIGRQKIRIQPTATLPYQEEQYQALGRKKRNPQTTKAQEEPRGIPADNILPWFNEFLIDRESIPPGEIVYVSFYGKTHFGKDLPSLNE